MSTPEEPTRKRGRRKYAGPYPVTFDQWLSTEYPDSLPLFIPHNVACKLFGIDSETLLRDIKRGLFPNPADVQGRKRMYPVTWLRQKVDNGTWPRGVRFG